MNLNGIELGKKSSYDAYYDPDKLFPIPRLDKRKELGLDENAPLPFFGFDLWNHYEVSWLNLKGKPMVGIAQIIYDCCSPYIIESKSMKLYFNSFNQSQIEDIKKLQSIVKKDIQNKIQAEVKVIIYSLNELNSCHEITNFKSLCIDDQDIECHEYTLNPQLLKTSDIETKETIHSHLLKSNCLVTYQPDWGSIEISYHGPQINHASLLKYLVSYRNHNEFHEQCIERIFLDIMNYCKPKELTILGRYTRRGGVDINPFRTSKKDKLILHNPRLLRQ
jgi:7-cyano-7-deazaguanine reductase